MKYLVLVAFFFGVPLWLLSTYALPELEQMKLFYSTINETANRAAGIEGGAVAPQFSSR